MGAAVNASRSGDLLNDRYELCDLVEACETHQLYSARDTLSDRLVNIALLRPEVALRAGVAQRFVQGPKQLTKLDHPNVTRVWSVESDATGIPFVVEEPRAGRSLSAMLESFPEGMPLGVAINLLGPIAEATGAAHGRGLVHGALDAEHVLLVEQSGTTVPKIFGFGASDKPAKPSDDVLALGRLFYRALSGQSALHKRREPLDELAPHLPLELTELVERCLASADERPVDARLLCDELSALRQRLGAHRASAVSAAVAVDTARQAAPEKRARRVAMERAETAPMSEPPRPQPAIDPHGATCIDADPPAIEPAAQLASPEPIAPEPNPPAAQREALEAASRDSIEFPMASARPGKQPAIAASPIPPKPSQEQAQAATQVDDPASTREQRAKGKGKGKKQQPKANAPAEAPNIAVAGPARLAAAFAPLEGGPAIEQGETREAELGRAFRQAQEEERRAREARFGRRPSAQEGSGAHAQSLTAGLAIAAAAANKNGKHDPARPTAAEVIALGQLHAQREAARERRSRFFGALLLMLFCVALARFVPILTGDKAAAAKVLGAHVTTGMAVFSALSVVVLIKVWALQIQSKSMLLKPVTYTLKMVVLCSVVLASTFMMTDGSLGMISNAARRFLPWASAAFFLFLGFYGMMRGLRESQVNVMAGVAMTIAYGGSFVGSYSIAANVIVPSMKGRSQAAVALQALQNHRTNENPEELLEAAGLDPELSAEIIESAAAEDGFKAVRVRGADRSDEESIESMSSARKRNSAKLENLQDKLQEMAK